MICTSSVCAKLKNMKSDTSSLKLTTSKAQWEKVIALAAGEDRLPKTAENAARKNAVSVSGGGYAAVLDALVKKRDQRGPQQKPTKLAVTVRYNPEVIAYFKATGDGCQMRMNDALREWVTVHRTAKKYAKKCQIRTATSGVA